MNFKLHKASKGRSGEFQIDFIRRLSCLLFLLGLVLSGSSAALAQDLSLLSIEELVSLDVTSVSKKPEKVSEAAAAVYVVTAEDIRRSGVTNVWDAIRLAPGVTSQRLNSPNPSVGIRGFSDLLAAELLVLQDGRTIFEPSISGTRWRIHDVALENIERIEVIRGPGGTMWGVNAVNGVVNIITKNSELTQGTLLSGGGGSYEQGFGTARYGSYLSDSTTFRGWVNGKNRDEFDLASGSGGADDKYWQLRSGFRTDTEFDDQDKLMVTGDVVVGEADSSIRATDPLVDQFVGPAEDPGLKDVNTSLLGRWTRELEEDSDVQVQSYYEFDSQESLPFKLQRHTFDIDAQHRFQPIENNDIVWGANFRVTFDDFDDSVLVMLEPKDDTYSFTDFFAQNEMRFFEEDLKFIYGAKVGYNDFSGWEVQPNIRAAWTGVEDTTFWAAVSRAVRTPNRIDSDVSAIFASTEAGVLAPVPVISTVNGNDSLDSESIIAYEVGARSVLAENFSFDISAFYNDYSDFRSVEAPDLANVTLDPTTGFAVAPFTIGDRLNFDTVGVELVLDYRPTEDLRLVGTWSYIDVNAWGSDTTDRCGSGNPMDVAIACNSESGTPKHVLGLTSRLNLPYNLGLDAYYQWVDSFGSAPNGVVDAYHIVDVRLSWNATENLEFEIVGRDLIEENHVEFIDVAFAAAPPEAVPRSVYAGLTWKLPN